MLFDQREKSYLFFSLFSLISSPEKSRERFREKRRVKREKWKVQKEKAAYATFLFDGGGGSIKINAFRPKGEKLPFLFSFLSSLLSLLWKSRAGDLEKSEEWKEKSEKYKKKKPLARLFFLVAGVGFEPHDLRVMSPTRYQTAPSRDIMVPEAGVEPVREVNLTGF